MKKAILFFPLVLLFFIISLFFQATITKGALPIPSDTIVGLYHPFRDFYAKDYPNGIPYKNFLITDPVRQQYPWRNLSIDQLKQFTIPLWNPYAMAGVPHFGNIQTASIYPLNVLFFVLPFSYSWTILVFLQPLLAGIFLYFYLKNRGLAIASSLLGAIAFALSGFVIAWLTWNTIVHVALWLPLLLLSIDKIIVLGQRKETTKSILFWSSIFTISLISSFLAGHLQTFFYIFITVIAYLAMQINTLLKNKTILVSFVLSFLAFSVVTFFQWFHTFILIAQSARTLDQADWQKEGWFIPWHHLVQFIAPDFFGNPATLNYWGTWNYGELIGYIGIIPLIFALVTVFIKKEKNILFFLGLLCISFVFALPTVIAKIPFWFDLPFLSTSQPTRLLILIDFALAVLAAYGLDHYIKKKSMSIFPLLLLGFIFLALWIVILFPSLLHISQENIITAKRNIILPTLLFGMTVGLFFLGHFIKHKKFPFVIIALFILLTIFDLLRFGNKFTPFTPTNFLFPKTTTMKFLQANSGNYRVMTTDARILPPNFSLMYKIQSIDGYDPLYLRRYGELIHAAQANSPRLPEKLFFNRIITPHTFDSRVINLFGVKYVLSLDDIRSDKLSLVHSEGQTRVYENSNVLPRAFFVKTIKKTSSPQESLTSVFDKNINLQNTAIVESKTIKNVTNVSQGSAEIISYAPDVVRIKTINSDEGFLVLTDSYYPFQHAEIEKNGVKTPTEIFRTDYHFRGVFVPAGEVIVEFYTNNLIRNYNK